MLTIPKEKLPIHIACIMDGNGRWANSGYGGALCGLLHDP